MSMFYCKKHKRIIYGSGYKEVKFQCGCKLTDKEAKKWRLKKKVTFVLPNGDELSLDNPLPSYKTYSIVRSLHK